MSLQMGFIDSGGFFGVASETARDVGQVYAQAPIGSLPPHKFEHYTKTHDDYLALPESTDNDDRLHFSLEVYVDDFIGAAAAQSRRQLDHVSRANLHGIHDVFPPATVEEEDPNSVKKLRKGDGAWALDKDLLGFDFNGDHRTMILDTQKREVLLNTLKEWTRAAKRRGTSSAARIDFTEFRKVICQLRNAAISIPAGKGLLSEASRLASLETSRWIFIRVGQRLYQELHGWRTILREATAAPTKCTQLVTVIPMGRSEFAILCSCSKQQNHSLRIN